MPLSNKPAAPVLATFQYDIKADLKRCNPPMAHLFRVDAKAAASGLPQAAYAAMEIHRNDVERVKARYAEALQAGKEFIDAFRMIDADGEHRFVLEVSGPVVENGRLTFAGTFIDLLPSEMAAYGPAAETLAALIVQLAPMKDLATGSGLHTQAYLLDIAMIEARERLASVLDLRRSSGPSHAAEG